MNTWITTPITAELVRGALELEPTAAGLRPHRLPAWARAQARDGQLAMAEAQPSGVRLVLRTEATAVELDVLPTKLIPQGLPPRPAGVYELLVDGAVYAQSTVDGGNRLLLDPMTGTAETQPGPVAAAAFHGLPGGVKDVEIWLPHNELTELVALRANAPVTPAPASGRRVWVHHGSSISHGSNAATPTGIWPAVAAALGGVELVNLGLSGSAMVDPFTARTLRDLPADLISVKLGINVVNGDVLRLRAFGPAVHGFLDTIREGHPDTPLLVVSPILCPIHEDTPGPGAFDPDAAREGVVRFRAIGDPAEVPAGRLTLTVIRRELARIVEQRAAEDANLYYLDGRALYGEQDFAELPLPDALHPDAASHRRMGERFAELGLGVLTGSGQTGA